MRVLVIGGTGMLGHKLVQAFGDRFEVWTTIRGVFSDVERYGIFDRDRVIENIDVTDLESVRTAIENARPDVVVNATGIIKQVRESEDSVLTLKVNAVFPQRLAELAMEGGFRLITIGTDCVFSGDKGNYAEADVADARDLYGTSKLLGEVSYDNCLTIRTSIIGRELAGAHGLIEWFLSNRGKSVKGYVNAIYSGFPTVVLAEILSDIISDHPELSGIHHVSSDPISKHDLLHLLNEHYRANVQIEPFEDYVIDRSLNSSAFRNATGFLPQSWNAMIKKMAADPTHYDTWRK